VQDQVMLDRRAQLVMHCARCRSSSEILLQAVWWVDRRNIVEQLPDLRC
jgi:hypothetical protein